MLRANGLGPLVFDAGSSDNRFVALSRQSPCVTKARAQQKRLWLLDEKRENASRLMTTHYAWMQGWRDVFLQDVIKHAGSDLAVREAIGNATTAPVINSVLKAILQVPRN